MSLSVLILSAAALLTSSGVEAQDEQISRSFLTTPKFTKLTAFSNPKNASEVLVEVVETIASKTLYWVSTGDFRDNSISYSFTAQAASAVTSATLLDSSVPSSERGVAVANDAALTALLTQPNDTNAFAPIFGDAGVPSNKFLFRVDSDKTNDIVCLIAAGSFLGVTDAPTLPAIACAAVLAGTLTPVANAGTPQIKSLDSSANFGSRNKFKITVDDINFAGTLRITSKQRGSCTGAPGSSVVAGLIALIPVTCNSTWKQDDGNSLKCSSGFKHAALELSVSYVSDRYQPMEMYPTFTGFVVAGKSEDAPGTEVPAIRIQRVTDDTYTSSSSAENARCAILNTAIQALAIADGLKEPFDSGTLFSVSAKWRCPSGVCSQNDFDSGLPSSAPFGSSSSSNNSILDCSAAGLGVLSCLSVIQSPDCAGLTSFASLGGSSGGDETSAPAMQMLTAAQCKCADKIFDCLLNAGCKINAAARTADQIAKCKVSCPDSTFCAASALSIHRATLLAMAALIATMMVRWN